MANQSYRLIDPDSNLSEEQVAKSVKFLRKAFMTAWWEYRERNSTYSDGVRCTTVVTNFRRDRQQNPIVPANADMTIYNAQIEFAYLIDEIQRGHIFEVPDPIRRCNELIDSLK